jgi:GNAT superfamily N-acetyltransferase
MSEVDSLVIRQTLVADIPVILEMIHGLAAYEKMTDEVVATPGLLESTLFSERPDAHCVLAEMGSDVVGIAIYFFNYSTFLAQKGLHLEDLFVKESARGRGYGEKILRYLAGVALEEGCGRFEWTVLDWNQPAINFYEKMGAEMLTSWRICRVTGQGLSSLASNDGD